MQVTTEQQLHLGCFDSPVEGWFNTDITLHIWVSRIPLAARALRMAGKITPARFEQHRRGVFQKVHYLNVSKKFPYADNSFGAVFTCHMLEHLYPDVALQCVKECLRVLRPGGVLRIAVPDLDRMVTNYDASAPDPFLNAFFQHGKGVSGKDSHHWHYNFRSLRELLLKAGYSRVERREFGVGDCPDVEKIDRRPESLFAEAYK